MDVNEANCEDTADTDTECVPDLEEKDEVNNDIQNRRQKLRHSDSTVWKYFEKVHPESEKMAKCNFCHRILSYRSTVTNLKSHLTKHDKEAQHDRQMVRTIESGSNLSENLEDDDRNDGNDPNDDSQMQLEKHRRPNVTNRKKCFVWKYFTKMKPLHTRMARCNYCHKMRSYRSTVTNLKRHMTIKHPDIVKEDAHFTGKQYLFYQRKASEVDIPRNKKPMYDLLEMETDNDEPQDTNEAGNVNFSSEIWRHFDVEDGEATCGLCRESIPSSLVDMKNHLGEKHSSVLDNIAQKVLDAASDEDVLGDDDIYTEVVYLEDEKKTFEKTEKSKKRTKVQEVKTGRKASTSSDEFIPNPKHKKSYETDEKEPDELEMFIKYITVLLKKVPKESSQKLHLDIINSIMNATQPQNKIVMETVNFDNAIFDKSIILSQNGLNTSDVNLNTQRVITVPLQHLMPRNETNTSGSFANKYK